MVDFVRGGGDVSAEASFVVEFVADCCVGGGFFLLVDYDVEIWDFFFYDCSFLYLQSVSIFCDF